MTRFAIQRTDDKQFWAGGGAWVATAPEARTFPAKDDAVVTFVMEYAKRDVTVFNPVPVYGSH